jgi:hypothetical protein
MTYERSTNSREFAGASGEPYSALSWGAIIAGAVASLALSLVLSTLVAGFGLKLVSPWPGLSQPSSAFSPMLGAALVAVQVVSSAMGGYLSGRLRTKWLNLHSHEAHFRDTAHGLLAWGVSTIAGAVLITTVFAVPDGAIPVQTAITPTDPAAVAAASENAANIAAQIAFFMGFGLLLSAFTAAVAAALGGLRREEMYLKYWADEHRA